MMHPEKSLGTLLMNSYARANVYATTSKKAYLEFHFLLIGKFPLSLGILEKILPMLATYETLWFFLSSLTQKQYYFINEQPIPFVTILLSKIYLSIDQHSIIN